MLGKRTRVAYSALPVSRGITTSGMAGCGLPMMLKSCRGVALPLPGDEFPSPSTSRLRPCPPPVEKFRTIGWSMMMLQFSGSALICSFVFVVLGSCDLRLQL